MTTAPGMRAEVREARRQLAEGREALRQRHAAGAPGAEVCAALSDLFDAIILDLFEQALDDLGDRAEPLRDHIALAPHGGFGRRDVSPFSDVDLMLLHDGTPTARLPDLAQRLLRDLCDAGLVVGQSVRTMGEAWRLARQDAIIWSSLVEARLLGGSVGLFSRFATRFARQSRRRAAALCEAVEKSRRDERLQYGETVYLLEPNLKRSPGCLRDIQLVRWIGFARHGSSDLDALRMHGMLAREDEAALAHAHGLLLRLRNELHFQAGKANDVLDRVEQLRIAERWGYRGEAGLLPVEQFMRDYFRATEGVGQSLRRFLANARRGPRWGELLAPLVSHQFERDFRVGPTQISTTPRGLKRVAGDLPRILQLAVLSSLYDKPIAHATCEAIRAAVPQLGDEITPETARRFCTLLDQPARLGESLRRLHEMQVLEKIIPAFDHARCLLQFNEYHKYTVDEHCLRAVEQATDLAADDGPLGHVYRHIKRKWLLHLALLLHDLGKGYPRDHSEVGLEIAQQTAGRLHLAQADADLLGLLVHKHLLMSHLAFRRDTTDEQLVVRFAVEIGSPEAMQMLFVLTAADLAAVGPGVLNTWKIDVLADLHRRAMQHLAGDSPAINSPEYLDGRRRQVLRRLSLGEGSGTFAERKETAPIDEHSDLGADESGWFERQLAALPGAYLHATSPEQAADELRRLKALQPGEIMAVGRYLLDRGATEYTIGTYEDITPGIFYKLAGALAGRGLQVLSAEIHTLADGLVFDRFYVHDPDFAGPPPPDRIDEVTRALTAALAGEHKPPTFRRVWRAGEARRQAMLPPPPTKVRIDNHTSERFTVFDIFAADRLGLLYTIARALFESELSVSVAKIGTYLDQVVDVFYVTDRQGQKLEDRQRLDAIRQRLLAEIEAFERQEQEVGRGRSW
ncbi:MAG TPA: [protein-PII] uridylyltransferase [Pirellulales bacterium]